MPYSDSFKEKILSLPSNPGKWELIEIFPNPKTAEHLVRNFRSGSNRLPNGVWQLWWRTIKGEGHFWMRFIRTSDKSEVLRGSSGGRPVWWKLTPPE